MSYLRYLFKALHPARAFYLSSTILKDSIRLREKKYPNKIHMSSAMHWLSRAQKINGDGGVSSLYSMFDCWGDSYIETTGYIISTFFNYGKLSKSKQWNKQALEMADFEVSKQLKNGGFEGGLGPGKAVTFNTGQVIFGLCRAFEETKKEKYRKAATKAADLLLNSMNKEGCFVKNLYKGHIHTYNTRTAWSLLRVHKISKKQKYKTAALKNFDWAMTQQQKNGWFKNNGFFPEQEPLVHTIAYSIRGLLEAGIYSKNKKYLDSSKKAADVMIKLQRKDGSLAGSFDKNWKSSVSWSCLTGNSQMSIIWLKLYEKTKEKKYLDAAKRSNCYNKKTQNVNIRNSGIRGAIAGAYPIYGWYAPFCYINWGTKFFVDALMLEDDISLCQKIDS